MASGAPGGATSIPVHMRHAEPSLLILVRAQQILEPHLRSATRDSGLPGVGGRRLRSASAPHVGHQSPHSPLERGHLAVGLADGPRGPDRDVERRRRRLRGRLVRVAETSRYRRPGRLRWHRHAYRAVGSRRRRGGQKGGGDRHRGQRGAGRSRTGPGRRTPGGVSAHTAVDGSQGRPCLQRKRIGAIPTQPPGGAPAALADLEIPARQHRDDGRRPGGGRPATRSRRRS